MALGQSQLFPLHSPEHSGVLALKANLEKERQLLLKSCKDPREGGVLGEIVR